MRITKAGAMCVFMVLLILASCKQKQKYLLDVNANKAMAHILDSIGRHNVNKDNPFSGEAQLAFYDGEIKLAGTDEYRVAVAKYYKARALLIMGREKDAMDLFKQIPKMPALESHGVEKEIETNYALANLRYGERVNCVSNHMAESCVFPIQNSGVHQNETGSAGAIKLYQQILTKNPDDLSSRWLLNLAYMTLGEYPQKVPQQFLIPGLDKDTSGEAVKPFIDVAADLKLDTRNMAGGVIVDDFNNDGYLDIVTSDWDVANGSMHFSSTIKKAALLMQQINLVLICYMAVLT